MGGDSQKTPSHEKREDGVELAKKATSLIFLTDDNSIESYIIWNVNTTKRSNNDGPLHK